ncbi:S9 family peptidase [uncultured Pseudokineococcus sp.]|uniref:alpha/beta hydrolase family protein n=1 Tax=uncultured Pseudokineococcus sp. TaxID=1642928 RepID=UPI00262B9A63|nr:alpha/beta fold hydrolase [uncultured Pseudokineococcus sp.]
MTSADGTGPALAGGAGPASEHRYGSAPRQVAELHLPAARRTDGVAVLVHGGFWRPGAADGSLAYDRRLEDHVAADLLGHGVPVWLVDYRAVGDGGGWPATPEDAAAALDLLTEVAPGAGLDASRAVVVGHSAGGHLAAWAASRHLLPAGAPGAGPRLRPIAVVSQAGVLDLVAAAEADLGRGAAAELLGGGPAVVPDRYALASPAALVPTGVPVLCVTGDQDDVVPPDQAERYDAAARAAGDDVRVELVPGEDHSAHLDPRSRCWAVARDEVLRRLAVAPAT